MVALMEEAAVNAVKELLPSGQVSNYTLCVVSLLEFLNIIFQTSVGVAFNVQHLAATPLGLTVSSNIIFIIFDLKLKTNCGEGAC